MCARACTERADSMHNGLQKTITFAYLYKQNITTTVQISNLALFFSQIFNFYSKSDKLYPLQIKTQKTRNFQINSSNLLKHRYLPYQFTFKTTILAIFSFETFFHIFSKIKNTVLIFLLCIKKRAFLLFVFLESNEIS